MKIREKNVQVTPFSQSMAEGDLGVIFGALGGSDLGREGRTARPDVEDLEFAAG